MRRKTRKSLVHLVCFFGILFTIIYLNHPGSKNKIYAWNKIRYKTTSTTLPEARGICPGLAGSAKPALVVARVQTDDTKWLKTLENLYHLCIYTADAAFDKDSTHSQIPANRGHEAMAYLTFLIDNYDHIPAAGAVFVHGSRFAWHNDSPDYDNAALLATLNLSSALAPWGYHNLRCDWSASTCPPSEPAQGSLETSAQALLVPWDDRAVSDAALPRALASLFGGAEAILARTDAVRSQCCAQFVVSPEQIWGHSRDEYVALRQWLLDGSGKKNKNAAPRDDRVAGRILSYIWHILFIKPESELEQGVNLGQLNTLACPRADDCYCRLYGRCDLENCRPGSCSGEYRVPRDFKLPGDWAATHS